MISDPASGHTILLDHLKKEAIILPLTLQTAPKVPPGSPQAPAGAVPPPPPMHVEDLGKSMIEGHEVEGKRFTLPAMAPPPKPQMPKPQVPQASVPGAPQMAKPPAAPKLPEPPTMPPKPNVTEVWSSVKLKTPVLTKVSTAAGEQTTYCKPTSTEEPHPSVFQIPQEYKIKPPKL